MKSDPSFTNTIVWNTLPLPPVSAEVRKLIVNAGRGILVARERQPEKSLAEHYAPDSMTVELLAAHDALDKIVDQAFGAISSCKTARERQRLLFSRYEELIAPLQAANRSQRYQPGQR